MAKRDDTTHIDELTTLQAQVIAAIGVKSFKKTLTETAKWVYTFKIFKSFEFITKIKEIFRLTVDILMQLLIFCFPPAMIFFAWKRFQSIDRFAKPSDVLNARVCLNCLHYDTHLRSCIHPIYTRKFGSGAPRNPAAPMCEAAERKPEDILR